MLSLRKVIQYVAKRVAKGYSAMDALCFLKSHMKFTRWSVIIVEASSIQVID